MILHEYAVSNILLHFSHQQSNDQVFFAVFK